MSHFITNVYPEYDWTPSKFESAPKKLTKVFLPKELEEDKETLTLVEKKLGINKISDWYNVVTKVNIVYKKKIEIRMWWRLLHDW
jgi:hypothetical protein